MPLLVREALPRRFSISHAVLPLRPTDPNTRYIKADLILVSRGGIHVLRSIHRGGSIQAPREGEWTAMGQNKEPESFPSPIRGGYAAKECIGRILTQEQISNVPITIAACFSRSGWREIKHKRAKSIEELGIMPPADADKKTDGERTHTH